MGRRGSWVRKDGTPHKNRPYWREAAPTIFSINESTKLAEITEGDDLEVPSQWRFRGSEWTKKLIWPNPKEQSNCIQSLQMKTIEIDAPIFATCKVQPPSFFFLPHLPPELEPARTQGQTVTLLLRFLPVFFLYFRSSQAKCKPYSPKIHQKQTKTNHDNQHNTPTQNQSEQPSKKSVKNQPKSNFNF